MVLVRGGVLGSLRHKGFIPWDDDIDIFMERNEFERLKNIFANKLSDRYELHIPGENGFIFNLPQIYKKGTTLIPIQSEEGVKAGLCIDIFILENTYNNVFLRYWHGIRCTILLFVDSCLRMQRCSSTILKYTNGNQLVKREVDKRAKLAFLFRYKSLEQWLKKSDSVFSELHKKTDYLVCPSGSKHFFGEIYNRTMFTDLQHGEFEGEIWKVPNTAREYCKLRYGKDYMKIPDVKERERHVFAKIDLGQNIE